MFATAAAALPCNTAAGRDVFAASRLAETDQTEKICNGFARLSHMERELNPIFPVSPKKKKTGLCQKQEVDL